MSKPTKPAYQVRFILRQEDPDEVGLWNHLQTLTLRGQASTWIRRTLIKAYHRERHRRQEPDHAS